MVRKIPCPKQRVQALHLFFRRPLGKPLAKSITPAVEPLSVKVLENIHAMFDVAKANGTTTNDSRTFRRVLYTAMLSPDLSKEETNELAKRRETQVIPKGCGKGIRAS